MVLICRRSSSSEKAQTFLCPPSQNYSTRRRTPYKAKRSRGSFRSATVSQLLRRETTTAFTDPIIRIHPFLRNQPRTQTRDYPRVPHFLRKVRDYEISPSFFSSAFSSSSSSSSSTPAFSKVGFVGWYLGMVKSRSILTKSITSSVIYIAADLSSLTISRPSSEPYDLVRTLCMAGYGLQILGPSLHFWFNFMSRLFPK